MQQLLNARICPPIFVGLILLSTAFSGCMLPSASREARFSVTMASSTGDLAPLRLEFHRDDIVVLARDYVVAPDNATPPPAGANSSDSFTFEPGAYRIVARSGSLTASHEARLDGSTKGFAVRVYPDRVAITPIG